MCEDVTRGAAEKKKENNFKGTRQRQKENMESLECQKYIKNTMLQQFIIVGTGFSGNGMTALSEPRPATFFDHSSLSGLEDSISSSADLATNYR